MRIAFLVGVLLCACSSASPEAPVLDDAGVDAPPPVTIDASDGSDSASPPDSSIDASDASPESGDAGDGCFVSSVGVYGHCMTTSACAALGDRVSTPGYCPGAADVECCTDAPDVADNPPTPTGYKLMPQADVTPDMTTWAVMILHDPVTYPMWSTAMRTFNTTMVLARVEWHAPDFQNNAIHRGVTLYEPM